MQSGGKEFCYSMIRASQKESPVVIGSRARFDSVAQTLEGYAQRGVFRGFSQDMRPRQAVFHLLWHRERVFEFIFDPQKNTLRIPLVLPNVSAEMYQALKEFITVRHSSVLPAHRRIDPCKAQVQTRNRNGSVSITLQVLDGDDEYGVQKLIHLVHEIYLTFLMDGHYYDYMVENFDLDPDRM